MVKSKSELSKMTDESLISYLDNLSKETFNSSLDADTKVRYFINKYGKSFISAIKGTGLFLSGIMAQSILESGYGRNLPTDMNTGAISNNFAGIKYNPNVHSDYVTTKTYEVINGKKTLVTAKFAKFSDPTEGIKQHFKVLLADRYKNARLNAKNPEEQVKMIVNAGYASLPANQYVSLIQGNINRIRKILPFGRIE